MKVLKKRVNKNKKGFTLAEFLSAAVLLGILFIFFSRFSGEINTAYTVLSTKERTITQEYIIVNKIRNAENYDEISTIGGLQSLGEGMYKYEGQYFKLYKYFD